MRGLGTGKIEYNDTEAQFHKYKAGINKDQTIVLLLLRYITVVLILHNKTNNCRIFLLW